MPGMKCSTFPESFKRFECMRCGKCCTLSVSPSREDIEKIERLGYRRINFLRKGSIRKKNGVCMFLEKRGGRFQCSIHEMKPAVCRSYPYTKLSADRLFSCPGL